MPANTYISRGEFIVKVDTTGTRLKPGNAVTVRNQLGFPASIEQLRDVDASLKVDGATLVYNAATQTYEVKPLDTIAANVFIVSALSANGSFGEPGQMLVSNGNTVYWTSEIDGGEY